MYPHLLDHIIHEAEYYLEILEALKNENLPEKSLCEDLDFWNHIMEDHRVVIDGLLDPTEKDLKKIAKKFKNYKMTDTEGLLKCKIKSIIPPLLADHVLREANHYLRLLKMFSR